MAIQFLTDDWATAVTDAANADERFRIAAKGHDVVLRVSVSQSPASDDYYMHFSDGSLIVGIGSPPRTPDVEAELSYETNVELSRGALNGQTAAMTGQMKAVGNMMKMMSIGKAQDRLAELESGLDIDY
ncbi:MULTISPECIES: SCP2 sterol-binding domain-containing protein [Mycobacteriaceae]|jgi:putative sterol carrier protein|uniref:SCP-2 sterol transfer family protein n=6 Tax=Mycobacteriaceae TaxID=1762 RepID=A0AAW5SKM3_MYCNV|nr:MULTISPECIES: SCP2 sterol-binding domain-containing protein [Mycobacteriaceae]MBY0287461.1 SCP2 sterol-binding domain-containing protein [Mycobacteriaceae bacterium]RDH73961.1 sterol carrier protein [Mycolicibacterium moriokaense]AEV73684.1 putative sterol carrier protein [Mycolicibacterium rhodesiae NBB3]MCV7024760.1 SCP2 sterol-binding domain-containing protein [Mycolicibacterium novocastrense]MDV3136444.1 SCP2 sterol-binding domain-containing protein [Mycobacterium sp. 29Ha]